MYKKINSDVYNLQNAMISSGINLEEVISISKQAMDADPPMPAPTPQMPETWPVTIKYSDGTSANVVLEKEKIEDLDPPF
ncbi:MAG: hypothetical protein JSW41_03380 [Candidatus Aenigmatarchaeota archaeon]|nr:MAG: hypothetical protein JSW41_03380 [Candidatus Aenigmarchaeota archaeon]